PAHAGRVPRRAALPHPTRLTEKDMSDSTTPLAGRHVPAELPERIQHYIDGEFVDSADGAPFDVLEPVAHEVYVTGAARHDARLAELESFDSGLPISQALGQARRAAENFRFFADLLVAQSDDTFKVPGRQINYVNRKPIGVAGLITPLNTPFMLQAWKLGPALATGNTVVLKPAEFTPLSASLWPGIFEEAGLPVGVFNLVNGFGEEGYAGDSLVRHPDVPLISFTGESRTGQIIFGN